ncbi:MAG: hypothetical protein ACREA4_10445, partial [Nitrososphaera sp.]
VHLLLIGPFKKWQHSMLEAALDHLASTVHDTYKPYVPVELDDFITKVWAMHGRERFGEYKSFIASFRRSCHHQMAVLYVDRIMQPYEFVNVRVGEILCRVPR